MKLLVVEDETKTGEYLRQGLTEAGFIVDLVHSGLDGQHMALNESYDLLILDVMLPDIDGWRILQNIRAAGNPVPVLFLTARDSVADRVKGWNSARTTTSSSRSRSPNCWPACARCCAGAPRRHRSIVSRSPISCWTWPDAGPRAPGAGSC
jgi:CheY-like chemotaxis protein